MEGAFHFGGRAVAREGVNQFMSTALPLGKVNWIRLDGGWEEGEFPEDGDMLSDHVSPVYTNWEKGEEEVVWGEKKRDRN